MNNNKLDSRLKFPQTFQMSSTETTTASCPDIIITSETLTDSAHIAPPPTDKCTKTQTPKEAPKSANVIDVEIFSKIRTLLRCNICLESRVDSFQCANGHLMCRRCVLKLNRLHRNQPNRSACPTCRVSLIPGLAKCLLAKQLATELPCPCEFCQTLFMPQDLDEHVRHHCLMKPVKCRFFMFGCTWVGKQCEFLDHVENCATSKKSISEVESILSTKLNNCIKEVAAPGNAWCDIIGVLEKTPRGVFVCLRDIHLPLATNLQNNGENVYAGKTENLSQAGEFLTYIESCLNFSEKKITYCVKFPPRFQTNMRFRLLCIGSGNISVRVHDKFHDSKFVSEDCEATRYQGCFLPENGKSLMGVCRRLSEVAAESGDSFTLRFVFLMVFETLRMIRLPSEGDQGDIDSTAPQPVSVPLAEPIAASRPTQQQAENTALNPTTPQRTNNWISDQIIPTSNGDTSTVTSQETPEVDDDEISTSVSLMTNNNALEGPQEKKIKSARTWRRRRALRFKGMHKQGREVVANVGAAKLQYDKRIELSPSHQGQTVNKVLCEVALYAARGHMWRNLNAISPVKRRHKRIRVLPCIIRDVQRKLRNKFTTAIRQIVFKPLSDSWRTVKRTGSGILSQSLSILTSIGDLGSGLLSPVRIKERSVIGLPINIAEDEAPPGQQFMENRNSY